MHNVDWKVEVRHLALIFLVAAVIGVLIDALSWALWVGTLAYIGWTFYQLNKIQHWLARHDGSEPPESYGLWGYVLDGIYRLQRQSREERLRLQATVDYLQDSFASLAEAAIMIDKDGNIEWSNASAERLLGLKFPDDTGQQLVNLIRSPEFIRYFESQDYNKPLELISPVNSASHLQFQITFFGKGSRLLFARDITHTYRLQEMRKDFVGNVSHELRTPLTVINGYLENLMDSALVEDRRWRRAIEQMLAQANRMENLVQDLIVLTRLETVPDVVEQNRIDVCPLLEMIREEVLSVASGQRHITIDCDQSIALVGHMEELRSAFTNLAMNAAKYTHDGGSINIRWWVDRQHAYLSVSDDGIGIEPHHLPRLTERFYRVDKSRSVDTGGTGLGLAIVKHVLLHHQAELKINSTLDKGSEFVCVFPLMRTIAHSHSA